MKVWVWVWMWLVVDLHTFTRLISTRATAIRKVGSPLRVSGHGLDVQDLHCVSLNLKQLLCRWTVPCANCTVSSRIHSGTPVEGSHYRGDCQCHGSPDGSQQPCDCSRTCCWWGMGPYDYLERDVTIETTIFSGNVTHGSYNHTFNNFEIVLPDKLKTVSAVVEDRTRQVNVSWVIPVRMTNFAAGLWLRVDYRLATDITTELSWVRGEAMWCNISCKEGHVVVEVDKWWQRYQLRVRLRSGASTITQQEDGWWSQFDPVYVTTPPSAPTSAPTLGPGSFLSEDGAPGRRDLTLNWRPTPPRFHNGPNFTYAAIAILNLGEREEVILPNSVTNTFATFRNLSCDLMYRLEVAAVNSEGKSTATSAMVVGPSFSLPIPPALRVVVLHRAHVYELLWQHEGGVEAVNYTVYLCTDHLFSPGPCEDSLYWRSVGNVTSINLTQEDFGVRKQMTSQVRLAVSAVSGDGGWSSLAWDQCNNPHPYTTTRTLPTLGNPVLLNSSAVEVPWSLECEDRAGVVEAVEAVCCLGHLNLPEECTGDALMVSGDVWSNVVVIGGLDSGSQYTVWVRLQYRSGPSLWAPTATITIPTPDLTSWTIGLITTAAIIVSVIVIFGLLHCRRELVTFSQKTTAKIKLPSGIFSEERVCLLPSEESDPSRTDPSSFNRTLVLHTPIPTVKQAIHFLDPTNTTSEPSLYARKPTSNPTISVHTPNTTISVHTPNTTNPAPNPTIPISNPSIPVPNPAIATLNSANPALDTTMHSPNFITPVPSSSDPSLGYVDPFSPSFELTSDSKNVVNCDQNLPAFHPNAVDVTPSPTDSNFNSTDSNSSSADSKSSLTNSNSNPTDSNSNPTDSDSNPTDSKSNPTDSNSNPTDSKSNPTDSNSNLTDSNSSPTDSKSSSTNIILIPANLTDSPPSSLDTTHKPTDTTPSPTNIRDFIPNATDNIPNLTDIKDNTSNLTDFIDTTPNPTNNKDATPSLMNINNTTLNPTDSISNYIDPTGTTPSPTDLTDTTPNPIDTTPNPTDTAPSPTDTAPSPTDTTSNPTDTTSNPTDTASNPTDTTPNPTDTMPNPTDTMPNPTDTMPNPTDTTPNPTDTTPNPTDTTPNPTDTVPNPTDTIPNPSDTIPNPTDTAPSSTDTTPNSTDTTPNPTDTTPNPTDSKDTSPNSTNNSLSITHPTESTPNLTYSNPKPFIMGVTDLKNYHSESSATKRWTGDEVNPVSMGCGLTHGGWVLQRELGHFPLGPNSLAAQDSGSSTHNPPSPMPVLLTPSVVPLSSLFAPLRSLVVPHVSSHENRLSKTENQVDGVRSSMKMNTESPQMNPKQSEVNHKCKSDLSDATQVEKSNRKVSKRETLAMQNDRPCKGYVAVKAADHRAKDTSFAQSDTVKDISHSFVKIENYSSPDISAMGKSCTSAVEPALFLSQFGCVEDTEASERYQNSDYIQLSVMNVKVDDKESMTKTKQSMHQNENSQKLNITPLSSGYVAIQYSGEVASAVTVTE